MLPQNVIESIIFCHMLAAQQIRSGDFGIFTGSIHSSSRRTLINGLKIDLKARNRTVILLQRVGKYAIRF